MKVNPRLESGQGSMPGRLDLSFFQIKKKSPNEDHLIFDAPQSVDFHTRQKTALGHLVEILIGRQNKDDLTTAEDAVTKNVLRHRGL